MKVGLIGVGVMGDPMAKNLKKAGHDVIVYSRTPTKCDPLRALGIKVADSAHQAIAASEATILMVPSHVEVDQVLKSSPDGDIVAPVANRTIILMSTISPAYSAELGNKLAAAGGRYVEAPVSGSKVPAENAQLLILASSAEPVHIDGVQPLFDALGRKTVRCGAVPTAMRMKLANQLLLILWFEAITEATHFAKETGLDVQLFLEMMQAGPLANDVLRSKVAKLASDDFSEQAPIRNVAKDIGLVCEEASRGGVWVPIAEANRA
ncbi:MAG: NAD(P)-dependent oxidoreductase, partial [Erythrobacter sp.]